MSVNSMGRSSLVGCTVALLNPVYLLGKRSSENCARAVARGAWRRQGLRTGAARGEQREGAARGAALITRITHG